MTLRTLIVDDEPLARKRLRTLLRAEPQIDVIGDADDGEAAVLAIEADRPDLVFLDVQMPGLDGFGVIEALGTRAPAVIFVTAYDKYALQAFDAHAIDYLLKPFDRARLRQAIGRASKLAGSEALERRLASLVAGLAGTRPLRRLMVRSSGRIYFVGTAEIDWIEATGHYVTLHAGRDTHLLRATIADLAVRLTADGFARIERGTLVNLDRVRALEPAFHGDFDVVLTTGTKLRATRSYAAALRVRFST